MAFRNLWRNRSFSFINLAGLAIGMAGTLLLLIWINYELSFEMFHDKKDRLYLAWNKGTYDGKLQVWPITPGPLGPALKRDYQEVEQVARLGYDYNFLLEWENKGLKSVGTAVDPGFLTMFTFPLVKGSSETALNDLHSIVITEKLAKKLFGSTNPMGQIVKLERKDNFTVTGVMKDLPNNTAFSFDYLVPFEYLRVLGMYSEYWKENSTKTLVELKPGVSVEQFNEKIRNISKTYSNRQVKEDIFLYGFPKLHLYARFENGRPAGGRIEVVRLLITIALFILLIACINFTNLSTARSEKRAKEVGVKKSIGAGRGSLILQFIGESTLLALLAGIIAIVIVGMALPGFNMLIDKQLEVEWGNIGFWLSGILVIIITGIMAGSYPAFYLSSFRPVKVLKGTFKMGAGQINFRKILVVFQFTLAIIFIISTIIVQRQVKFAQMRDTGYKSDNLVFHYMNDELGKNYELIRHELINEGIATAVCKTSTPITNGSADTWDIEWQGKDAEAKINFDLVAVQNDFIKTFDLRLIAGRDISTRTFATDSNSCMLNETAVKAMGLKEPVGKTIRYNNSVYSVVGVFEDFILRSPYEPISPMFVFGQPWTGVINVRLNPGAPITGNMSRVERIFKKYNVASPFEIHFVDEEYARKFIDERRTEKLSALSAMLAIFISCLGLFGLAAHMAESRTKEIGIRKVLGASVMGMTGLLIKDFIRLVAIAVVIASPIAWYAMSKWLESYTYRTTLAWWIFVVAGLGALMLALLTVSLQAIKAALANPVRSLRSE